MRAIFMCGLCLRAISGGKSETFEVRAYVTKLSDSVRCNICSSVVVIKGSNTSNIMKHLLTKHIYLKQCAVFTMSPISSSNSRDTFTSNADSAVELHS